MRVEGAGVDQRADERAVGERVADRDAARRPWPAARPARRATDAWTISRRSAGAALAGGADGGEDDGAHGEVEVGRRRDDHRRCCRPARAGERPKRAGHDAGRRRGPCGSSRWPRRAATSGWSTSASPTLGAAQDAPGRGRPGRRTSADGLLEQRLAGQGGERRLLRRLPDHRVAADEGERGVPGPDRDREVEGGDDADGPERVPRSPSSGGRALGLAIVRP